MEQQDASEFYKKVLEGRDHAGKEIELLHKDGSKLTCEMQPVERKALLDEINRLPDEMMDLLSEADDADEAEEEAVESDMLRGVSGTTIDAFENITAMGLGHPEMHEDDFKDMAGQYDFEVLFPIGANIIEMSLEETGVVQDFQILD